MKIKFLLMILLFLPVKPADAVSLQGAKAAVCGIVGVGSAAWGLLNTCAVVLSCPRGIESDDEFYNHVSDLLAISSVAVASSAFSVCCFSKAYALCNERSEDDNDAWYKKYGIQRKKLPLRKEISLLEKIMSQKHIPRALLYTSSLGLAAISALLAFGISFSIQDEEWRSSSYQMCRYVAANSAFFTIAGLTLLRDTFL